MSGLIDQLHWYKEKDNRGIFADLRCFLIPTKRQRAWPALNRLNVAIRDEVSGYIAAWYATHPEDTKQGSFGTVCRQIQINRKEKRDDDKTITPTERRFQQLLASEKCELPDRITRFVLMAKSQGVSINYEQLSKDIEYWNDRVKTDWAQSFWTTDSESPSNEESL